MNNTDRQPIGFANYQGDVTAAIQRDIADGVPKGPNHMGELMWPVTAAYDPEIDKTRVGFSLIPPLAEVPA